MLCIDLMLWILFIDESVVLVLLLEDFGFGFYFVKDYVKLLSIGCGLVVWIVDEVIEVIFLIWQFCGQIEGGVCICEFIEFLFGLEECFFVVNG